MRALTREDLACLSEPRPPQGRIKKFRNTHHRLAKLFAAGLSRRQIMEISGYSNTRLSQYDNDPAFQELVTQYKPEIDAEHAEEISEFVALEFESAMTAARLKQRKLQDIEDALDAGEEVDMPPLTTLLAVTSDFGDRFGHPKQSRQTSEIVDFAKIMEANMARMGKAVVIDAEPVHVPASMSEGKLSSPQPSPSPPTQPSAAGLGLRRRV